jgi:hypothetical protein
MHRIALFGQFCGPGNLQRRRRCQQFLAGWVKEMQDGNTLGRLCLLLIARGGERGISKPIVQNRLCGYDARS